MSSEGFQALIVAVFKNQFCRCSTITYVFFLQLVSHSNNKGNIYAVGDVTNIAEEKLVEPTLTQAQVLHSNKMLQTTFATTSQTHNKILTIFIGCSSKY